MDSRRISQEFTPSIIYDDDEDEVIVKAGDRTGDKAHTLIRTEDIIKEDRMPGDKLSEDELSQGRIQWGHESLFPQFGQFAVMLSSKAGARSIEEVA